MGIGRKNKRNLSSFVLVNKKLNFEDEIYVSGEENVTSQNLCHNVFNMKKKRKKNG